MRAQLTAVAVLLGLAAPAAAGTPLALAERQVVTLEFSQAVARIATTDPDLLGVKVVGSRVTVSAARGGRASLDISFNDGVTVTYDVTVAAARRPAGAAANELALAIAEERRFRSPGIVRVLVEENGVARVAVDGDTVKVTGLSHGQASLVLVDAAGAKTTWQIRVR